MSKWKMVKPLTDRKFRKLLEIRLRCVAEEHGLKPIPISMSDQRFMGLGKDYNSMEVSYIEAIKTGSEVFDFDSYKNT